MCGHVPTGTKDTSMVRASCEKHLSKIYSGKEKFLANELGCPD